MCNNCLSCVHLINEFSSNLVFNSIFNGGDEFCYTDLLQPDPRRTRHFLAQMIRFFNFKCELAKEIYRTDNEIVCVFMCTFYYLFQEKEIQEIDFEKKLGTSTQEVFFKLIFWLTGSKDFFNFEK